MTFCSSVHEFTLPSTGFNFGPRFGDGLRIAVAAQSGEVNEVLWWTFTEEIETPPQLVGDRAGDRSACGLRRKQIAVGRLAAWVAVMRKRAKQGPAERRTLNFKEKILPM